MRDYNSVRVAVDLCHPGQHTDTHAAELKKLLVSFSRRQETATPWHVHTARTHSRRAVCRLTMSNEKISRSLGDQTEEAFRLAAE